MIYQDPLAYLVGLEGVALLDGWAAPPARRVPAPGLEPGLPGQAV
ncbi:hypothetical protein [Nesterenkonia alkaliphila]